MSSSTDQFPESSRSFSPKKQSKSGDAKVTGPSQTAVTPDSSPDSPMSDATTTSEAPTPSAASSSPSNPKSADAASSHADSESTPKSPRQQPIPPPSEPMQYRAIGLVRGRYLPSEEQFNRGELLTDDGAKIDAVLLGRVTSLVKKHLDPEADHLWVVYPRTREKEDLLHLQIVGVWEPESLQATDEDTAAAEAASGLKRPTLHAPQPRKNYFSIRGEIVYYSDEEKKAIVKIQQAAKRQDESGKAFKLNLEGELTGSRTVGHFWDLTVERHGEALVIQRGDRIAMIPPQKHKKRPPRGGPAHRFSRPQSSGDRPLPSRPSKPVSKPFKPSKPSQE